MQMIESVVASTLPFANELASVLTSSGASPFRNLYVESAHTVTQKLSKQVIDFAALFGILMNAVLAAQKHGKRAGLVKGFGVLVIAFVIPNLYMHEAIERLCHGCGSAPKLMVGLFLIGVLTGVEVLFDRMVVERIARRHHDNPHSE